MENVRSRHSAIKQNSAKDHNQELKQHKSKSKDTEPELKYSETLLTSLFPPLLILIAFGGKPTFITLGFGSTITYILDLLGTVQVIDLIVN